MCVKPSSDGEHELLDMVSVQNLPNSIVPGGADSRDLDESHCSWSDLLFVGAWTAIFSHAKISL